MHGAMVQAPGLATTDVEHWHRQQRRLDHAARGVACHGLKQLQGRQIALLAEGGHGPTPLGMAPHKRLQPLKLLLIAVIGVGMGEQHMAGDSLHHLQQGFKTGHTPIDRAGAFLGDR